MRNCKLSKNGTEIPPAINYIKANLYEAFKENCRNKVVSTEDVRSKTAKRNKK